MLRALGEETEALCERYPVDIEDTELFPSLAARKNLVFISSDKSQRTKPWEKKELKKAGLTVLYLGPFFSTRMKAWDQAVWLLTRWRKITAFAETVAAGTCADINQKGTASVFQL